ncbi:ribonuclease E inhibitor RraB [Microbacterium sp. NPDC057407]|uniref:ribonuclease E inhibitor RraB n=1 Tax=Microbacterium sp. NPDC057407 TaxID=3346120 RepID=UPI00366FDFA3
MTDDRLEREWTRWLEQRTVRLERGDDLGVERQVDHTLFFNRRWHAIRAAKLIAPTRAVRVLRTHDRPRWIVEASCTEDLTDDSVRHSLEFMLTIARVCRGTYDGFGAPVVRL